MNCFADVDGIFADFVGGICRKVGKANPYLTHPEILRGEFWFGHMIGLPGQELLQATDRQLWANLEWMPDGRTILSMLERKFGKENIYLLTNPSGCPEAAAGKVEWIRDELPWYYEKHHYYIGGAKYGCALPGAILVDDYNNNVDAFRNKGQPAILIPRAWNRKYMLNPLEHLETALCTI